MNRIVVCTLVLILAYFPVFSQAGLQVKADTVKVKNSELVIQNNTSDSLGFLYNKGGGQTSFKRLRLLNIGDTALAIVGQDTLRYKGSGSGKSFQFKTGTSGAPIAGDSVFSNTALIGGNVKVWRNGVFQYRDDYDGIFVDSISGKIIFRPALTQGDRIYIEAMTGISLVFEGTGPGGPPPFSTNLTGPYAGVFYNGDNTFTLRWATNNRTLTTAPRIVGLGSSTLSGYGLAAPNRLGDKIGAWLSSNTSGAVWINIAVAGYASPDIMPVSAGGIAGTNIDSALHANPDFIFISLPSNDVVNGLTNTQILANYRKLDTMALHRGIPIFWETTQPRTAATAAQQTQLKVLADSIRAIWPTRFVEGFSNTVYTSGNTDAQINPAIAQSDGVHLTSDGNQLIANSLFARWQSYFQALTGVASYTVETSADGSSWSTLETISDPTMVKKTYTRTNTGVQYFRVKALFTNQASSAYSNVVILYPSATTGSGAPTGGSANRILVDLGGDGATTMSPDGVTPLGQSTTSPDANGNYWNNWYGTGSTGFRDGAAIANLVATNNAATTLSLKMTGAPAGTFNSAATQGINANGFTIPVNDYPASAVSDNMFLYNSINPDGVALHVTGLDRSKAYSIKLWGARLDNAATPRILETRLGTEDWSASKTVDTRYAPSDAADYSRDIVYSNISGQDSADIYMRVGNGSTFASVSLLDISVSDATGGTDPVPTVLVRDTSITLPNSGLTLTGIVTTNGATISSYSWSQISGPNTTSIASNTSATCTITGLTTGSFVYRLTVTTATGKQISDDATVTVSSGSSGNTILRINFSNSAISVPGWFNVHGPVTGNHVTMTDNTTGWGIDNVGASATYWIGLGGANAADTIGAITGNNSGVVPDVVLDGCWFNYSDKYSGIDNMYITGLNPAKTYTLQFVASRSAASAPPRYGAYHINGGEELLLNAASNTSGSLIEQHIAPDSTGKIRLAIYAPSNTGTNGNVSYLNALIITQE